METSEISFCNKIATNLLSEDFKKSILDKLTNVYNISIFKKSCFLLNSKIATNITKNVHLLSTKTVGNQYYLFMTKINDINYCFYIDKKTSNGHKLPRIISTKYRFDNDIFNDTLFEGELVRYNNIEWMFIINNIHLYKGKSIDMDIIEKIELIHNIFTHEYVKDQNIDICKIQIMKYFSPNEIEYFINDFIPNLQYKIKGIYFTPINKKYANLLYIFQNNEIYENQKNNTYDNIVSNIIDDTNENKEKIKTSNTKKIIHISDISPADVNDDDNDLVIFKIIKTGQPDIYELYANNNDNDVFHSIAYLPTLKISKQINKIFSDCDDEIFMECEYSSQWDKWIPLRINEKSTKSDSIEKVYKITNKLKKT